MAYITVDNLKYRYPLADRDRLALGGISFQVEKGEFIGIIGRNNAGKSTLCQALGGIIPSFYKGAYGGSVTVDGMALAGAPMEEICRRVGSVFQNPFSQVTGSKLTVSEEVAFGLENMGVPAEEMRRRVDHAMELLDIGDCALKNPFDLSGGQMQRMAIAGVIAMEPEVIVLDEPTSQLDPQGAEEVFRAVRRLSREGITIFLAEHNLEKIAAYCDRILLLDGGLLVDEGPPDAVFSRTDLEEHGVVPPVYTRICRALGLGDGGRLPATLREAVPVLQDYLRGGETP